MNLPIAPAQRQRLLQRLRRPAWLGTLRRTTPLSDAWGFDRGTPVDRYYIERFLEQHRQDICGRVLEIKDSAYTDRYGDGVRSRDVLDIDPSNRRATIIADLTAADCIPPEQFDCFILTQTLQFIYDTRAALTQAHRILRPGGVLLVTVPAVSRLDRRLVDYWRFTVASCSELFGEVFGRQQVQVQAYGNVLTAMAFLTGMAHEELSRREIETHDQRFPVIIAVCARRPQRN
ncbi:MAG TPA: methyltransferase domain-containing protein [Roseiflexaceae bacterium]|nr:methyltransferase domain-containing protein [Roseiflexaceae bacterium]